MAVIVSLVVLYNIVSLVELADDQGGDGGILALGNHPAPPLPAPQFTDNQTLISKECKTTLTDDFVQARGRSWSRGMVSRLFMGSSMVLRMGRLWAFPQILFFLCKSGFCKFGSGVNVENVNLGCHP